MDRLQPRVEHGRQIIMDDVLEVEPQEHLIDQVFAPVDRDNQMERIGGGFETEVYLTEHGRYLVKLKSELGGDLHAALEHACKMRERAEQFVACLGPEHSIPSYYILSRDSAGKVQVLVIQPFIQSARPLYKVDYTALSADERREVADQLCEIIRRQLVLYRETGYMPDLYGLSSTSRADRLRMRTPHMLPWHVWSFLVRRNLLCSSNLLLTDGPRHQIVLVDYDLVPWHPLLRRIYFAVRRLLCWRDYLLITGMEHGDPTATS